MLPSNSYFRLSLATADQSRQVDQQTIESFGIPGETLMEIAGNRTADIIRSDFPAGSTILVVCGKGNNAGDALVAARLLLDDGYRIILVPALGLEGWSDDASRNLKRLRRLAEGMGTELDIRTEWNVSDDPARTADLIVDGIFGTGLRSETRAPVSDVIHQINSCGKPVYALDLPSGLHCDTGERLGHTVKADKTLQFGVRKLGCYIGQGPNFCGKRLLLDLPFPNRYKSGISVRLLDETLVPEDLLAKRGADDRSSLHKYNNGVVHVIGGSAGLTGAPLYAAKAAWALGMGAVTLIHPSQWLQTMDVQAPSLIKHPVGPANSVSFTEKDSGQVLDLISEKKGVTVIGPGIGRDRQTLAFVAKVIRKSEGPIIVDADGLLAVAENPEAFTERKDPGSVILTPHPGELKNLAGTAFANDSERLQMTRSLAQRLGCNIVSKGNPVMVHCPRPNQTLITGYDTSVFARAGFGDILAGQIAAFMTHDSDTITGCELALLHGYQHISTLASRGKLFPEPSDFT
ncbi:NAD(P)H-hydrate dehydratase [Balneolales bacterium ANBcel1]|nr:NAD(P)H-hydrate dehydratase [Balneolales bacterium ANBcel1]